MTLASKRLNLRDSFWNVCSPSSKGRFSRIALRNYLYLDQPKGVKMISLSRDQTNQHSTTQLSPNVTLMSSIRDKSLKNSYLNRKSRNIFILLSLLRKITLKLLRNKKSLLKPIIKLQSPIYKHQKWILQVVNFLKNSKITDIIIFILISHSIYFDYHYLYSYIFI